VNRRTTIKSILAFGTLTVTSFSIYQWFNIHKKPDLDFINSHKNLLEELCELIIPATETPGAKDAGVADFIIKTVNNCLNVKEQNNFISGLKNVEKFSMDKYDKSFVNCNHDQKVDILTYFQKKDGYPYPILNKIESKLLGRPFYSQLREFTVYGYCSSELGATKGLAYDYIPVNFEPCTNLLPDQKSWATK